MSAPTPSAERVAEVGKRAQVERAYLEGFDDARRGGSNADGHWLVSQARAELERAKCSS